MRKSEFFSCLEVEATEAEAEACVEVVKNDL